MLPAMQMRAALIDKEGEPRKLPSIRGHIWVPVDDAWTLAYNWICATDPKRGISDEAWTKHEKAAGRGVDDYLPGSYRLIRNLGNDYLVDRELQRSKTYTGITGLNTQDYAVQEGMGPIVDRSREHLGSSDKAIIAARRLLLDSLKTIKEGHPPAGSDPEDCRGVRPAEAIIKADEHWRDAMADLLEARW
jgi:hypothetical protein